MKIRNGFVSNSSSASFIVQAYATNLDDKLEPNKCLISKEQLKILKKLGFRYTNIGSPERIEFNSERWLKLSRKHRIPTKEITFMDKTLIVTNHEYMCAYISCNQHDIICPLVKHKIPFHALSHYGHESIFYDGEDKLITIPNYGIEYSPRLAKIYEDDDMDYYNENPLKFAKITNRDKYLEEEEEYNED